MKILYFVFASSDPKYILYIYSKSRTFTWHTFAYVFELYALVNFDLLMTFTTMTFLYNYM